MTDGAETNIFLRNLTNWLSVLSMIRYWLPTTLAVKNTLPIIINDCSFTMNIVHLAKYMGKSFRKRAVQLLLFQMLISSPTLQYFFEYLKRYLEEFCPRNVLLECGYWYYVPWMAIDISYMSCVEINYNMLHNNKNARGSIYGHSRSFSKYLDCPWFTI